jgi:hypothetical protein
MNGNDFWGQEKGIIDFISRLYISLDLLKEIHMKESIAPLLSIKNNHP